MLFTGIKEQHLQLFFVFSQSAFSLCTKGGIAYNIGFAANGIGSKKSNRHTCRLYNS